MAVLFSDQFLLLAKTAQEDLLLRIHGEGAAVHVENRKSMSGTPGTPGKDTPGLGVHAPGQGDGPDERAAPEHPGQGKFLLGQVSGNRPDGKLEFLLVLLGPSSVNEPWNGRRMKPQATTTPPLRRIPRGASSLPCRSFCEFGRVSEPDTAFTRFVLAFMRMGGSDPEKRSTSVFLGRDVFKIAGPDHAVRNAVFIETKRVSRVHVVEPRFDEKMRARSPFRDVRPAEFSRTMATHPWRTGQEGFSPYSARRKVPRREGIGMCRGGPEKPSHRTPVRESRAMRRGGVVHSGRYASVFPRGRAGCADRKGSRGAESGIRVPRVRIGWKNQVNPA